MGFVVRDQVNQKIESNSRQNGALSGDVAVVRDQVNQKIESNSRPIFRLLTGQSGGLRYRHAHPGNTSPTDFGVFLG